MNLADLDLAPDYRRFWWVLPPAGMAVVLFVVLQLFGPARGQSEHVATERISDTFVMRGIPTVRIDNWAGDVQVMGQRDNTVLAMVVREGRGDSEQEAYADLTGLLSRIERQGETVTIRTWRDDDAPHGEGRPLVQVTVPYGTRLEIATGDGDVNVSWVRGPISASTDFGDVTVTLQNGSHFTLDGSGKLFCDFELQPGGWPTRTVGAPESAPQLLLNALRGTVRVQKRGQ